MSSAVLKTWSRFSNIRDGTEMKFKILEVSEEKYEEVLDFFMEHFVPDEPCLKAAGIALNASSFNEYRDIMIQIIRKENQIILICCIDNDSDDMKIVGAEKMSINKKGDPIFGPSSFQTNTRELQNYFKAGQVVLSAYDVYEEQHVDSYLGDRGLVVHSEYRGFGIAGELLKACAKVCKVYKVPLVSAWMSAVGTQKAANKLGWEIVKEIRFEDLERAGGYTITGVPDYLRLMIINVS